MNISTSVMYEASPAFRTVAPLSLSSCPFAVLQNVRDPVQTQLKYKGKSSSGMCMMLNITTFRTSLAAE